MDQFDLNLIANNHFLKIVLKLSHKEKLGSLYQLRS